jgi:hypothetical protein
MKKRPFLWFTYKFKKKTYIYNLLGPADTQLWDRQGQGQRMAILARRQYWKGYGDVKPEKPTNLLLKLQWR